MASKNVLLNGMVERASEMLSDPEKSVTLNIIEGKAPGKLDLIHSLFPPRGMQRNNVPVKFTFETRASKWFEICIMVSLISCDDGDGPVTIFGFVQHDQGQKLNVSRKFNPYNFFVVVDYNLLTRKGEIHLSRELCVKIDEFILNSHKSFL